MQFALITAGFDSGVSKPWTCLPESVHLTQAATPGCTKQACAFRDSYGKFKDVGAEVFGISSDDVQKNSEFAKVMPADLPLQGFRRACRC